MVNALGTRFSVDRNYCIGDVFGLMLANSALPFMEWLRS